MPLKSRLTRALHWLVLPTKTAYGILLVILLTGLVFASYKLPFDPDLFWHIRAGQDILHLGIPHVDWYSHTMSTFFWVNHEFAQDVLFAWVHRLVGFRGLSILWALVVAATLSFGVWWSMAKRLPWTWSIAAGLAIALGSRSFMGVRPQMLTWTLILLLVGLLRRALTTHQRKWFVLVPVLFLVWANLHASFVAGFIVLFVVITCESVKLIAPRVSLGRASHIQSVVWLALTAPASLLATFANPYGYNIWLEPYRTLTDKALHNNIVEWFAPQPYSHTGYVLFGVLIVYAALLVIRQTRNDLTDTGLTLAFFASSLLAVRNIPIFLLFAIPLSFEALRTLKFKGAELSVRLWPTLLAVALFTVAGISEFPVRDFTRLDRDPGVFTQSEYPEGAAAFLAAHPEFGSAKPFNEYGWGGYLLYRVPWFKTFIDGRMPSWVAKRSAEQGGDLKIIDKYFTIDRAEGWKATVAEFGVDMFVIKPDHKLVGELSTDPSYKEVFKDAQAVVYVSTALAGQQK